MALRRGDRANFNTLVKASDDGQLALMEMRRRSDGAVVAGICAVYVDEDNNYNFVPLATMVEGNPYELFDPPNPEGGFFEGDD